MDTSDNVKIVGQRRDVIMFAKFDFRLRRTIESISIIIARAGMHAIPSVKRDRRSVVYFTK